MKNAYNNSIKRIFHNHKRVGYMQAVLSGNRLTNTQYSLGLFGHVLHQHQHVPN